MTSRTIAGVLFDLDNTLIDRDLAFLSWAQTFVAERLQIDDELAATEVARLIELDDGGYGSKPAMFAEIQSRYPDHIDDAEVLASEFTTNLRDHIPPLDEPTLALLAALEAGGVPWGIVTNGSPTQLKKIERVGLDRARCVIVSGIIGVRKPERAIFHAAADGLGVAPAEVLFVGDNIEADIIGAANAGMITAWMRRGREWPVSVEVVKPDFVVNHVEETRAIIWS